MLGKMKKKARSSRASSSSSSSSPPSMKKAVLKSDPKMKVGPAKAASAAAPKNSFLARPDPVESSDARLNQSSAAKPIKKSVSSSSGSQASAPSGLGFLDENAKNGDGPSAPSGLGGSSAPSKTAPFDRSESDGGAPGSTAINSNVVAPGSTNYGAKR